MGRCGFDDRIFHRESTGAAGSSARDVRVRKKRRRFARPTAPLRATFPASRFRVRHRRRAAPDKILLFVHGPTYPAETALSIASNG